MSNQVTSESIDQGQRVSFRNGMALLASAVNVVTTDGSAGRAGITASAVCSVSDSPPTFLVCINRNSYAHRFFVENRVLCVNVLDASQQGVSEVFASREITMTSRFAVAEWGRLLSGAPALRGALVNLDGEIVGSSEQGTHTIFFAKMKAIDFGSCRGRVGLAYFNRSYHRLTTTLSGVTEASGSVG